MGRIVLLVSAFLVGASGLGLEGVLLSASGLALGYSRSSALGLGTYVAGWACGAWLAGRARMAPSRGLLLGGIAVAAAAALLPRALFAVARDAPGGAAAGAAALATLFVCALPQGTFLPWLVGLQKRSAGVGLLLGANLLGSVVGAHWLGYRAVAELGRISAAGWAGAVGLSGAALAAWWALRTGAPAGERESPDPATPTSDAPESGASALTPRRAGALLALATLWTIALEWIALRNLVLWADGTQETLAAVLAVSLTALAAGAFLSSLLRGSAGLVWLWFLALASSSWLFLSPGLLERSVEGGGSPSELAATLAFPLLVPFGAFAPHLYRLSAGAPRARLGRLFGWEAWGALLAGPLAHWVLVPRLGTHGAVLALGWIAPLSALLLPRPGSHYGARRAVLLALVWAGACAYFGTRTPPVLRSPQLANPALTLVEFDEDSEFAVSVVHDGLLGEDTLLTDRFRAAGTGRDYRYMRVLGHLPLLLHPEPERVAVVALGTGTTLGAVARHPAAREIDVLEISAAVVDKASYFEAVNGGAIERDPRVRVRIGDGRRTLGASPGRYDVVTLEPLLPDSPFGVYLYTRDFYGVARRALAPGGLVCQWVPPHALEPATFLAVVDAFTASFEWHSLWLFGTQLILVGADAPPAFDAARMPAADSELGGRLAELGLDTPAGLLARWIGSELEPAPRALTDVDPWIAFADKSSDGLTVRSWLPRNLETLLAARAPLPPAWRAQLGDDASGRLAQVARLQRAQVVAGELWASPQLRRAVQNELGLPDAFAVVDPGVVLFAQEIDFLEAVRTGVALLAAGSEDALEPLLRAAELRGERADVHLYLAVALARSGSEQAGRRALAAALERCPRVLETTAGQRALQLGLPQSWL